MLHAGLDVGALFTKAVVLQDGATVGSSIVPSGRHTREATERALGEALEPLRATPNDIACCVATGAGKQEVPYADEHATEVVAVVEGCRGLDGALRGIIDLGAESTLVVKLDEGGNVLDFGLNEKCAAGTGIFLDAMGEVMGVTVEEMGPLSLRSTVDVNITSTCVVFAESEVVSQVHRQTPKEDILHGIHKSIATRVNGLVNRVGLEGHVLCIGGLAKNSGIIACLRALTPAEIRVADRPQLVCALGAARMAAARGTAR